MGRKMDTVKHNIKLLVKKFPDSKNNYNMLIVLYWQHFDGYQHISDIAHTTPSESITRAFRELVRKGEIAVNQQTLKIRRNNERKYRLRYQKERC
ncbi:hypothetical protein IMZ31_23030 (plasmid) [Pontibacillus sp. ALD_SL1]|uniref:hypothetical protein n=1 Tax=Pontibacillus sp. ALD_SL1 TaxID=2777185 RepID=UPI001A97746D|nr:hypothetical protein [Pontibacillus sp. ALD_SL1]QST02328.1 hypothetical protein IMZ31_23030 [Pontibacillus sp. ALD_SL1]